VTKPRSGLQNKVIRWGICWCLRLLRCESVLCLSLTIDGRDAVSPLPFWVNATRWLSISHKGKIASRPLCSEVGVPKTSIESHTWHIWKASSLISILDVWALLTLADLWLGYQCFEQLSDSRQLSTVLFIPAVDGDYGRWCSVRKNDEIHAGSFVAFNS
jgi:hypothetical protein